MTGLAVASTVSELDVLELVRATILVSDRDGTIVRAHGGSGLPLGYAQDRLIGHNAIEFIDPQDHQIMSDLYLGVEGVPIVAKPEPFPLRIIGPDGAARVWECVPRGFVTDDIDGWIVTLTCRKEQNPSIAAMDCLVAGGSALEIAGAVALRYQENSTDDWRKSALVLYRPESSDGVSAPWSVARPPNGTDPALVSALEACLGDQTAEWNHLAPGPAVACSALPEALASAAADAGLPHCTLLPTGIDGTTRLVFVRLSNFEYDLQGNNLLNDRAIGAVLRTAFESERSRTRLSRAMHTDPLTGIANRRHFEKVLATTVDATGHAALFVDIDRFKRVNDTFGHGVGDAALREVATRLSDSCRPHDLVARIGGDEFGIVLRDVSADEACTIAGRIREAMQAPFDLDGGPGMISVTVGVASHTSDVSLRELVRRADLAMLADKTGSRSPSVAELADAWGLR